MIRLLFLTMSALVFTFALQSKNAYAETPTALSCSLKYKLCDVQCNNEDPKHGFSYATCSAGCVASKAACSSEVIYDKSSDWTREQYESSKPWVAKKKEQASEIAQDVKTGVDKALENSKAEYPQ